MTLGEALLLGLHTALMRLLPPSATYSTLRAGQ